MKTLILLGIVLFSATAQAHDSNTLNVANSSWALCITVTDTNTIIDIQGTALTNYIYKLAKAGEICKALGHQWREGRPGEGEGSLYGSWYADYHPSTSYRTCKICAKCESKTEGDWK